MNLLLTVLSALAYWVGFLSLLVWSVLALWNRQPQRSRRELDRDIARAQQELWSLDSPSGHKHNFLPIPQGLQLHYITPPGRPQRRASLIIFLHGFPDSCHIFARFLRAPLADHANLVSLDLPGFGGSDGLSGYGASEVLNAMASAIVLLRQQYLEQDRGARCVLVGHDWGSVAASRLAMETTGLIDRVVILNGVIPRLFSENIHSRVAECRRCLGTWWQLKSNKKALHQAKDAVRPVLSQLLKSNYIFMFRLPMFNSQRFGFIMHYLVSACHRSALKDLGAAWTGWSWASSIGPSVGECATSANGSRYGQTVLERALQRPHGDWDARLRLYREDLFSGRWTLLEGLARAGVVQVGNESEASFQCPASIVFGKRDFALDYRICAEGGGHFFKKRPVEMGKVDHFILVEDCGHWSPLEDNGFHITLDLLLEILGVAKNGPPAGSQNVSMRR